MVYLFIYGQGDYYVRIGFAGTRPLVYAMYVVNKYADLPDIKGYLYRVITNEQYDWLRNHLSCDVNYIPDALEQYGNLECRTHNCCYKWFCGTSVYSDDWEDREI